MGGVASKELLVAQSEVKLLTSQLRQSSNALNSAKKELAAAQTGASQRLVAAKEAEAAELAEARRKLELLTGELKVSGQERRAVERLRGELQGAKAEIEAERREKERLNAQVIAAANLRLRPEEHPIFGRLLHDGGDKKVYCASPLTVWAATPIWEKQRAFRTERAEAIAKAKAQAKVPGWPGTISVCEITDHAHGAHAQAHAHAPGAEPDGLDAAASCFVIDGQHRLGAAHLLARRSALSDDLSRITVELYPAMSSVMAQALFTEINKVQPVKLVDLPGAGASAAENAILTGAVSELSTMYKDMFKPSQNCRAPHLNVDTLRDELHRARVVARTGASSADELLRWLLRENERLRARPAEGWVGKGDKALAKATQHRFFLGMDGAWIHEGALLPAGDERARDDE